MHNLWHSVHTAIQRLQRLAFRVTSRTCAGAGHANDVHAASVLQIMQHTELSRIRCKGFVGIVS